MRETSVLRRGRGISICLTVGALITCAVGGATSAAAAATSALPGTLDVFAVSGGVQVQQLFTGADGRLWFVTPQSQLGEIDASGQTSLTGATLPHGEIVAQIAAAGPEGVWSYSNTFANPTTGDTCVVGLVTASNVVHQIALPLAAVRNHSVCTGATADASGNLWLSLASRFCTPCRPAIVAEIAPAATTTTFGPAHPGAGPGAMALGSNGAIWVLEGFHDQTLVSYTTAGIASAGSEFFRQARSLFARPDGTFWVGFAKACPAHGVCNNFALIDPTTGTEAFDRVFPVGVPRSAFGPQQQFAVTADGSIWAAGDEGTGPERLFSLTATGTIDRTASLPPASGGSPLLATGPLALSTTGYLWAAAQSGSGAAYVVRYQPPS